MIPSFCIEKSQSLGGLFTDLGIPGASVHSWPGATQIVSCDHFDQMMCNLSMLPGLSDVPLLSEEHDEKMEFIHARLATGDVATFMSFRFDAGENLFVISGRIADGHSFECSVGSFREKYLVELAPQERAVGQAWLTLR